MTLRLLQSLPKMSLAISIVVVICMAISFAALFFLYGRTKAKGVDFGVEDNSLKTELSNRLKKRENSTTYTQMLADGKKKEKIIRIITDAVLFVLIVFVGAVTVFSFVLRSKGEQIYFGDTAYLTVLTASMQDKNEDNPYLKDNDDGVRIHQYALIGIDKVDPADLKEGDIIAFKYEGNTIYVHRIVYVREVNGERFFTTMGDANDISSFNETNISADRIVGVFNGYHDGYLGVLLIYMRSDIGMVALIFVFLLLAVINAAEWLITRSYEKRQQVLAAELDGAQTAEEPQNAPAEEQEPVPEEQEPVSEEQEQVIEEQETAADEEESDEEESGEDAETDEFSFSEDEEDGDGFDESILYKDADGFTEEGGEHAAVQREVYYRSFKARLIQSDDNVKAYYGKLKNVLLSYSKVRSVTSWRHESFLFSNKGTAVKLLLRGKALCVRLPFDAETYAEAGIRVNRTSSRYHFRIRGSVTLGRALKAIGYTMLKLGAVAGEEGNEDFYLPYRTDEELINDNLIKVKTVTVHTSDRFNKSGGGNG